VSTSEDDPQDTETTPLGDEPRPYFYYDPDGQGAHAFYNPQNMVVQGGLGALYDERIDRFPWAYGFRTLNRSIARPIRSVRAYGAERFIHREFLPHTGPGQNYLPNWLWHFLGGGMRTKLLEEYYRDRGVPYPRVVSFLTMYSYHYLNEAVQAARFQGSRRSTIDPVADLGFFDWAGAVLFRFDAVNRFMSGTLHMREWSYQAQLDVPALRLVNNGQLYWMRLPIFQPVSLSFLTGEQITSLNLTVGWGEGHQLSLGAGAKSKAFIARKNGDTDPSDIVWNFGAYYSRDDNPFVVLTYEPGGSRDATDQGSLRTAKVLLNLYPGVVELLGTPLGITLAYQREAAFAGIAVGLSPLGVGSSVPP
jgi:hypothetical protein